MAWSSKKLHPKNDPTLRPGHSKPAPQLQTTASRFAYSNFGEDARGTHGRGSLLHRASVGRHGQSRDGQRLSPFRVLPRGPAKGLTEHRIRATVHPSPAAVTPGGSITVFQNQVPNSKGRAVIHSEELPPESQANYRPSHRPITARVTDQLPPARRGPRSGQPGSPAITPDLAD